MNGVRQRVVHGQAMPLVGTVVVDDLLGACITSDSTKVKASKYLHAFEGYRRICVYRDILWLTSSPLGRVVDDIAGTIHVDLRVGSMHGTCWKVNVAMIQYFLSSRSGSQRFSI